MVKEVRVAFEDYDPSTETLFYQIVYTTTGGMTVVTDATETTVEDCGDDVLDDLATNHVLYGIVDDSV